MLYLVHPQIFTSLTQNQLNAAIHHSVPAITKRAIHDFGAKMVADSLVELVGHISTQHLDQVADIIIAKASDNFLDKCLEKRLLTIETQPLTQALAKAERLGFGPDDELQQEGQHERVMPHEAYQGASAVAPPPPAYPPSAQQSLQCIRCLRTFTQLSAYDYASRSIPILGYAIVSNALLAYEVEYLQPNPAYQERVHNRVPPLWPRLHRHRRLE